MSFVSPSIFGQWFAQVGQARPFLKWAGGKQAFLQRFGDKIPSFPGQYIEPFLGSGAVFFFVQRMQARPCRARLGDTNAQLIRTFLAVRDEPEKVHEKLAFLQRTFETASNKAEFYYELRDSYNALLPRVDAASFIFLNQTCWNGLYRVNRAGRFNVPFGAPKNGIVIPSPDQLRCAAAALTQAQIRATSWQNTLAFAGEGDFVFLDPPYYSDVLRSDTKYLREIFTLRDHSELADALAQAARHGVDFILTNSGEAEMMELYMRHGFDVEPVMVPRFINSKTDRRHPAPEIIVRPRRPKGA
jgi:DNA adenine methylase